MHGWMDGKMDGRRETAYPPPQTWGGGGGAGGIKCLSACHLMNHWLKCYHRRRFTNHPNRPCNSGKIKGNEQKLHSTFLCAEHFYFLDLHLLFRVDPFILCYKVLNMGRVALFWCILVIFKSLIANLTRGTATLQNKILTVLRFGHSL